jgi:hypothetical protein
MTRDPAGYGGGMNLYAYCYGNPTNALDPLGLCSGGGSGGSGGGPFGGGDAHSKGGKKKDGGMWYDAAGAWADNLKKATDWWHPPTATGDGLDLIIGLSKLIRDTGHLGEKSATGGAWGMAQDAWTAAQWPLMVLSMGGSGGSNVTSTTPTVAEIGAAYAEITSLSGKQGFTKAGLSLAKHNPISRPGSSYPPLPNRNSSVVNDIAHDTAAEILTNPGTKRVDIGTVIDFVHPNGMKMRFWKDGSFKGFREPLP